MSDASIAAGCYLIFFGMLAQWFALPLVALVHCLWQGSEGPRPWRWVWVAVVVLLWPLGSTVYLLFGSRSRPLLALGIVFVLFNGWLVMSAQHEVRMAATEPHAELIERYGRVGDTERLRLTGAWGALSRRGYGNYVKSVAWSSGGDRLLVGKARTLELREVESGRLLSVLESLPANDQLAAWLTGKNLGRGGPVALSADGRFVLADEGTVSFRSWLGLWVFARQLVQGDRRLSWWDLDEGGSGFLAGHRGNVPEIAFRPGALEAVTAGIDGTVRIWDATDKRLLVTLKGHPASVRALALSHDGRLAVSGGDPPHWRGPREDILWLWDLEGRRGVRALDGHTERVVAVAFTADDRQVVSASDDNTFRVWDRATGAEVRRIDARALGRLIAFSPDARYAAGGRQQVEIWDLAEGAVVDCIDLARVGDEARTAAFSPAGDRLVVGTSRGALLFYSWKP